jgi:hypothetical protein
VLSLLYVRSRGWVGNVGHDKRQGGTEHGVPNRRDCTSQSEIECDIVGE